MPQETSCGDLLNWDGLDELLGSLAADSVSANTERRSLTVYPSHRYSLKPGSDVCVFYKSTLDAQFQQLRANVRSLLEKRGLGNATRFADAAILAYAITNPSGNRIDHLRRIIECNGSCDLSQYFIIPSMAFFEIRKKEAQDNISIGHLKLGPFLHAPFSDDLLDTVKRRIGKTGLTGSHLQAILEKENSICIARDYRHIKVLDLARLKIHGDSEVEVALLNYYFDDVALFWFKEFWREHLEWQVPLAASGADVLDRNTLYGVPGYLELSIFLNIDVNRRNGTISLIEERHHVRDSISKHFFNFMQDCRRVKDRWEVELDAKTGKLNCFGAALTLARYTARSREMKLRGYTDEAFVLLITGLEALLADGDESITRNISRRAAVILALTNGTTLEVAKKEISKLYSSRSKFVHSAIAIDPIQLPILERVCECVFFAALRSQTIIKNVNSVEWRHRWLDLLDLLYAATKIGMDLQSSALTECGVRRESTRSDISYMKMMQTEHFAELDEEEISIHARKLD